jgi:peptidoglycan hydrolase CwlO-like protein
MNDQTTLQNHLESFKSQMKEVNESLYKFESEFKKEKAKIEQLRHSFFVVVKLINSELLDSFQNIEEFLQIRNSEDNFK